MKIKYIGLGLAAVMSAAVFAPVSALAGDTSYSGYLDPETGEPLAGPDTENGRTRIRDGMSYDHKTKDFVYSVGTGSNEIHSDVADGMMVNRKVYVSTGKDSSVKVYKDGSEYTGDLSSISAVGSYVVSTQSGSDKSQIFTFEIIGKTIKDHPNILAPDGFYITAASRDEGGVTFDRYSVVAESEDNYHIDFYCIATGTTYSLNVTIDRTAPVISFTGKIEDDGTVKSELKFSGIEDGGYIRAYLDGKKIEPEYNTDKKSGTFYDCGNYKIQAFDAAGNMTEYRFNVLMYFNLNSIIFIALAAAIILAVVVYVIIKRKSLKIG